MSYLKSSRCNRERSCAIKAKRRISLAERSIIEGHLISRKELVDDPEVLRRTKGYVVTCDRVVRRFDNKRRVARCRNSRNGNSQQRRICGIVICSYSSPFLVFFRVVVQTSKIWDFDISIHVGCRM